MIDNATKLDRAVEDPEGDELARAAIAALVLAEIESAKLLDRMNRRYAFVYSGASSIADYGARHGPSRRRARRLADAGAAFRMMPELEVQVREGLIPIDSAAHLARILRHGTLKEEAWSWLRRAADTTPERLLREIRRRIAEEDAKQSVEELSLYLRPEVRDRFAKCRSIICNKAQVQEALSNEETFEFLIDYFLSREDPDLVRPGERRKGSTRRDPSRAIPAEVKRAVLRRAGTKCQVHGCANHLFLYFAHIESHASGGSREAGNLLMLCFVHHWALDHDVIRFSGTAEHPVFRNRKGEIIGRPQAPP